MRTGKIVGGICFDEQTKAVHGDTFAVAVLTDAKGYNVAEFDSLADCQQAAIRLHGVDVIFVANGKHMYDLVIETA